MKNFSEEVIEVGGSEYKLFLNRSGIALWEKTTKFSEFAELLDKQYKDLKSGEEIVLNDDFDPSKELISLDNIEEDEEKLRHSILVFYCVVLSQHHKMTLKETKEWFDKAENGTFDENGNPNNDAYGLEQLTALMLQMIENANNPINKSNNLKNLKALKSTK